MMTFRDNLQSLRAQRNMTQEQLAMLLGVSRQSISKWESEKAYPEMDKLLAICDLFGCTLDDLVLGDVNHPAGGADDVANNMAESAGSASVINVAGGGVIGGGTAQPAGAAQSGSAMRPASARMPASPAPVTLPKDLTGYDEHRRVFALLIASGIAAIIAFVGISELFDSDHSIIGPSPLNDFLMFACICVGVIIGLALLIPGSASHASFRRRHPYVEDFYTEDDHARETRLLAIGVVAGVAAILAGVAVVVYAGDVLEIESGWPNAIMLLLVAAAVFGFVYCSIRRSGLNLDAYNAKNEYKRKEREGGLPFSMKLSGAVSGIIMLVATIIGLSLLFLGADHRFFWIPWPIGGLLCAISGIVIGLFKPSIDERK